MKLCDYGCGQEAKYPFKNGKWCCSKHFNSCPQVRKKNSKSNKIKHTGKTTGPLSDEHKKKISKAHTGKTLSKETKKKMSKAHTGKTLSKETKKKMSKAKKGRILSEKTKKRMSESMKGKILSEECKKKISKSMKFKLKDYKEKYPFFYSIEELRENEKEEIQGRCKNHNCKNSKEKNGWFTLTKKQILDRKGQLENKDGNGGAYFYCSQHCKDTCPLYGIQSDPYKNNNLPYTPAEYQTCRTVVMERENGLCEYCGEPATDMHHIFPVKKEPFFALDPDYCIACCEKHHYKYAHQDECSTGNLAKIVCSVESQKFLNQK